ncbi:MAG: caspase family protein, partial [Moorea sp. SIO3I7]|nr:caspase family protein [Moorena sp. SIO3I7]
DPSLGAPRAMPWDEAIETFKNNKVFYKDLGKSMPTDAVELKAPVLLISGCQDEQLSRDGMINGRFTGNLKKVLREGGFNNYKEMHQKILAKMPPDQTPNYFMRGNAPDFEAQRPFQI